MITKPTQTEIDKTASALKFAHDAYSIYVLTLGIDEYVAKGNLQISVDVLKKCLEDMEIKLTR